MGHLDLYHRTTADAAAEIHQQRRMTSKENDGGVFFSTVRDGGQGEGYGDAVVHVRVPEHLAELDDEFPDGEQHYKVRSKHLQPHHFVGVRRVRSAGDAPEKDPHLLRFNDAERDEEDSGGSKWPNEGYLRAHHPEHGEVGHVQYLRGSRANSPIRIKNLQVPEDHRRKGYGSALMDELQRQFPKARIDHGDRTDAGKGWWSSYGQGRADTRGRTSALERHGAMVRASVVPPERRCPVCRGVGYVDDEGCMACDESGTATCPVCDQDIERHDLDGWQHLDGSVSHDRSPLSVSQGVEHQLRTAEFSPSKRIFGPTQGLDHRLWEGDHLRHDVSNWVLGTLNGFWEPLYGPTWHGWARVYFAGSEASEWTSETLEGNNDFDVLVGVAYAHARVYVPAFVPMTDVEITAHLNQQFRDALIPITDPSILTIEGKPEGPFSVTWYVNQDSWDIRDIKPYAAYNVSADTWAVRPPHLPDWSIKDFPPAAVAEARAVQAYVEAVLALPEPMRSQQADALWRHLHGDRSRAFSAQGEGWYDPGNMLEKWLDQAGLWEQLAEAHFAAVANPDLLLAPAGWSNDPKGLM